MKEILKALKIKQCELASFTGVTPRTVRRWISNPNSIPKPIITLMKAWQQLEQNGLSWKPAWDNEIKEEKKRHQETIQEIKERNKR
jgi:transcriptional regulator with XRE-family HTH domain